MSIKKHNKDSFLQELKEPHEYPGFLLLQTANIWYRNVKNVLKKSGTTFIQFSILTSLMYLSKENKNINQKQIARHAKIDAMMTSDVLKTLESKKLVIRYPNSKDRRHNCIKITQSGINLVLKIFSCVVEADTEFFKDFGEDIKPFTEYLEKLIRANYDEIYMDTERP